MDANAHIGLIPSSIPIRKFVFKADKLVLNKTIKAIFSTYVLLN